MSTKNTRHVPARDIPVPEFLSPMAKAVLDAPIFSTEYPAIEDKQAWHEIVKAGNEVMLPIAEAMTNGIEAEVVVRNVGETKWFDIKPDNAELNDRTVVLDMHGGGLIVGGGEVCKVQGVGMASRLGRRVWTVDYRMPPEHPYPAALDDGMAAYKALLEERSPSEIIISGVSAGGNVAAALTLRIRDSGLPMPTGVYLATPEVDLTESGDSFHTNMGIDNLTSLMQANIMYADGHDLTDPYLSPLFGDFSKGFPPTMLEAGTRDLYLSNTVRMHRALRAANIRADLHVVEAGRHGNFPPGCPEGDAIIKEVRLFIESVLQAS